LSGLRIEDLGHCNGQGVRSAAHPQIRNQNF
jgi:hypothetical protein